MKPFIFYFLFFIFYFLSINSHAQINRVPNASFEKLKPGYVCGLSVLYGVYCENWFQPTEGSSDLFSRKCSSGTTVPYNSMGYQNPRTGDNYAGTILAKGGGGNQREYVAVKLFDTLEVGKNYCVRLYMNLANNYKYAVSNIGVCLSSEALIPPPSPRTDLYAYTPQLTNNVQNLIFDTLKWMRLEWQYQALGNEVFITIGNFKHDTASYIVLTNNIGTQNLNYTFIDDISIIDISTPAYAGHDTTIAIGDSVFIGRPPEIGLNDDCFWFVNGSPIDTVAGMWITPDTTTTYILKQDICGTVNYDTVTVTVQPSGNYELGVIKDELRVYPNPAQTSISIACKNANPQAVLQISDVLGNVVKQQGLQKEIDIKDLANGIYFVKLKDGNSFRITRFVKE